MNTLQGELRRNEPMSKHTSWRVGGPADIWYRPQDRQDLQAFLSTHNGDVLWLGLGSNLLVRDGGIRGAAVTLYDALAQIELRQDHAVYVEAGAHCARLAKFCAQHGLAGGSFFAGIPGTLGGALSMNAGAFGDETWPHVRRVEMLNGQGEVVSLSASEFQYAYRSVEMPIAGGLFVSAELAFELGDAEQEADKVKQLLRSRRASQPVGQPSCGSVFRNPPGDHAARLIEACGLKGFSIGGACVAEKHANFILNTGAASAADIESLIAHVGDEVERQHGVRLCPEVRVVGEALQ
ncbi:MAG: UDP-N-acetylmuramate dehydrogenase [Oceanococcus sp.]